VEAASLILVIAFVWACRSMKVVCDVSRILLMQLIRVVLHPDKETG
jgi:hypothetical protein